MANVNVSIPDALAQLDGEVDALGDAIELLAKKLEPVSSGQGSSSLPDRLSEEKTVGSQVAHRIQSRTLSVQQARGEVLALIERLDF